MSASASSMHQKSAAFNVAIIGAGFAGICMGIRLKQAGIDDFVIYERANELGGTWRDNTYPGCACDVPSHLYSFSFDLKKDWPRVYSSWEEIQGYLRLCAEKYGLNFLAPVLQAPVKGLEIDVEQAADKRQATRTLQGFDRFQLGAYGGHAIRPLAVSVRNGVRTFNDVTSLASRLNRTVPINYP